MFKRLFLSLDLPISSLSIYLIFISIVRFSADSGEASTDSSQGRGGQDR